MMAAESVQPTVAALARIQPLAIEIPTDRSREESKWRAFCNKHFSEHMETKTKIYICILLILPSLLYFLFAVNFSRPKHAAFEEYESHSNLNISTFSEEKMTAEEYAEAFDLAVKNDQLVVPTGFTSESMKRYISSSSSSVDSAVYLLRQT